MVGQSANKLYSAQSTWYDSMFMVTKLASPAAVAAPVHLAPGHVNSSARFMWTLSTTTIHHQTGTAEGFVYIVSQPNVIITKITGYNEAA